MARNGSGTYTVPNTFTAGTSITASGHNANLVGHAAELTNSVAADGQTLNDRAAQGGERQRLGSEPDVCGRHRHGPLSQIRGEHYRRGRRDAKRSFVTDRPAAFCKAAHRRPGGRGLPYAGSSAPTGYLLATARRCLATTYADLFHRHRHHVRHRLTARPRSICRTAPDV
jgi:hypothetical protein